MQKLCWPIYKTRLPFWKKLIYRANINAIRSTTMLVIGFIKFRFYLPEFSMQFSPMEFYFKCHLKYSELSFVYFLKMTIIYILELFLTQIVICLANLRTAKDKRYNDGRSSIGTRFTRFRTNVGRLQFSKRCHIL